MNILDLTRPRKKPSETSRIVNLPTRVPPLDQDGTYHGPDLTPELRLEHPEDPEAALRPVQSWALDEIRNERGGILAVGVGHGKTLIAYGTPTVLNLAPEEVLVLVPANLRDTFRREGLKYARNFDVPPELPVLSYAELSRPSGVDYLERTRPKVIICDEAHYLRSSDATRTRRFMHYLDENPDVTLVAMSGTLFTSTIRDGQALMLKALGEGAPVPAKYSTLEWWSAVVDVPNAAQPDPTPYDYKRFAPVVKAFGGADLMSLAPSERKRAARAAFHARFASTPGVVHTRESSAQNALTFQEIRPGGLEMMDVAPLIEEVEATWTRPDGEELEDDLRVNETLRSLALGYYQTWDWGPDGKDDDWNEARLEYLRQVRKFLRRHRPGLDSPFLVEQALRDGRDLGRPDLEAAFADWDPIRDRANPTPRGVVVTDQIVAQVVRFAQEKVRARKTRGIVWYHHDVTADILEGLGVQVFRPGSDPEADPNERGTVVGMSIASHGTGKNLQAWADNFVLYPPANGKTWEQLIGRTHRPGQREDEVGVYCVTHTPEHQKALRNARKDAEFAEAVQGQRQKLNLATKVRAKYLGKK